MNEAAPPFVSLAAWCEEMENVEHSGWLVRSLHVWPKIGKPPAPPGELIALRFAVVLYGGQLSGRFALTLGVVGPNGPYPIVTTKPVALDPKSSPACRVTFAMNFVPRTSGLYWGVVGWQDHELTRAPVEIRLLDGDRPLRH